jgi:hypothetical protein
MPVPQYSYGGTLTAYPGQSGVFLALIGPVPLTGSSPQSDGLPLQYGQTKTRKRIDDQSTVLFMGRAKPAVEFGQYNFLQFDLTYQYPPGYGYGGFSAEVLLDAWISSQQIGFLVQYQDAKGRGSNQYGQAYPALYGVISNIAMTDLAAEMPGWSQVTMTFTEVG